MSNNTFSAGVLPGGLCDSQEIKILICYIMNHFNIAFEKGEIADVLQNHGLANYFETSQAFDEMVNAGNIFKNEQNSYEISDKGRVIAKELVKNIPLTVREKAVKVIDAYFARQKIEKENNVSIQRTDNGYNVTCSVLDGEFNMMTLTLYAPDMECAYLIKDNFYSNPSKLYHLVLAELTGEIKED